MTKHARLSCRTLAFAFFLGSSSLVTAQPVTTLFNTGVDSGGGPLPQGSPDPHYSLISVPNGSGYPSTPFVAAGNIYPFIHSPGWVPQSSTSQWIIPVSGTTENLMSGNYVYRTTFDLTGRDPGTATLTLHVAVDDALTDILLNGASTGINRVGFSAFSSAFTITTGFHNGINTLDFLVTNATGAIINPTGLRVEVTSVPEPSAVLYCGVGVAGAAIRRWGRRHQ